jgi:hypothetical protein
MRSCATRRSKLFRYVDPIPSLSLSRAHFHEYLTLLSVEFREGILRGHIRRHPAAGLNLHAAAHAHPRGRSPRTLGRYRALHGAFFFF